MDMTFAENVKMLRKQAGMSQEQLAEKLGVSRQAVTKWETGAGIPDIQNIMAFIFYLFLHLSSPIFADIPQTVFQPVAKPYLRVVIDNEICRRLLPIERLAKFS